MLRQKENISNLDQKVLVEFSESVSNESLAVYSF